MHVELAVELLQSISVGIGIAGTVSCLVVVEHGVEHVDLLLGVGSLIVACGP